MSKCSPTNEEIQSWLSSNNITLETKDDVLHVIVKEDYVIPDVSEIVNFICIAKHSPCNFIQFPPCVIQYCAANRLKVAAHLDDYSDYVLSFFSQRIERSIPVQFQTEVELDAEDFYDNKNYTLNVKLIVKDRSLCLSSSNFKFDYSSLEDMTDIDAFNYSSMMGFIDSIKKEEPCFFMDNNAVAKRFVREQVMETIKEIRAKEGFDSSIFEESFPHVEKPMFFYVNDGSFIIGESDSVILQLTDYNSQNMIDNLMSFITTIREYVMKLLADPDQDNNLEYQVYKNRRIELDEIKRKA